MARSFFPEPSRRSSASADSGPRVLLPGSKMPRLVVPALSLVSVGLAAGLFLAVSAWKERRAAVEAGSTEVDSLREEVTKLRNDAKRQQRTVAQKVNESVSQLDTVRDDLAQAEAARADLEARLTAAQQAHEKALKDLAAAQDFSLRVEQTAAQERNRTQQLINDAQAVRESEIATERAAAAEVARQEQLAEMENLQDNLSSLREEAGIRQTRVHYIVTRAQEEVRAAETYVHELNNDIDRVQQQYQQACQERDSLRTKVKELETDVHDLKEVNTKLEHNVLQLKLDVKTLQQQVANSGGGGGNGNPAPAK